MSLSLSVLLAAVVLAASRPFPPLPAIAAGNPRWSWSGRSGSLRRAARSRRAGGAGGLLLRLEIFSRPPVQFESRGL